MRWIMGYIECQVPGGHLERFMNLCRHHEIELWKVKEREKQAVFLCTRRNIRNYAHLPEKQRRFRIFGKNADFLFGV